MLRAWPGRFGRAPRAALAAGVLILLGLMGCGQRPPDVIVVLVDTLRADHVSAFGGPPGLTPFIDSLGASGVVFTNTYSTSSFTNPSIASMFTSRFPSQHHVTRWASRLADDEVTLAERFADAGYRRVGVVGNFLLEEALGFGQGFDAWFPSVIGAKVRAHRVTQDAIRFYDRHLASRPWSRWTRRPLLLYLHYMEPHAPYDPPDWARRERVGPTPPGLNEADATRKLMDPGRWGQISQEELEYFSSLYVAEVAAMDRALERLFRRLRSRGLLDHAIVVVTADHGEEFRDHGGLQHGSSLYEELVRIPLVITGPGLPTGQVVTETVSIVDVAPTLLDLAGLRPEPRYEGRSLRAQLAGGDPVDVVLELLSPSSQGDVRRHSAGLVRDGLKVLELGPGKPQGGIEAFDLRTDPHEMEPNPSAIAQDAAALEARLRQRRAALATRAGAVAEVGPLDEAARARLRALGYIH